MTNMAASGSWSTGFCDWFSNCDSCCLTLWCPCVTFGRIAEITDRGTSSCCAQGCVYLLLGGFTHLASLYACIYRTKIRKTYGIGGSECNDCLASCCCPAIALCQLHRELQARGFDMTAGWEGNMQRQSRGVTEAPAVQGAMSR